MTDDSSRGGHRLGQEAMWEGGGRRGGEGGLANDRARGSRCMCRYAGQDKTLKCCLSNCLSIPFPFPFLPYPLSLRSASLRRRRALSQW